LTDKGKPTTAERPTRHDNGVRKKTKPETEEKERKRCSGGIEDRSREGRV